MSERWFVMLRHPLTDAPMPVTDEIDDPDAVQDPKVVLWPTEEAAREAMKQHRAAVAWGYEVYPWQ